LKSLSKTDYPNYEIIVVDNGSSDNSVSVLEKYPGIRFISSKENLGFAEGNNLGARNSKGRYIVFLNNDTIVEKNWLKVMVDVMEKDNKVGIVQGNTYSKFGSKEYESGKRGDTSVLGYALYGKQTHDTFAASGCCLMYRGALVKEPFDKDYFIYFEDTYLSWLLRLKGYEVRKAVGSEVAYSRVLHLGGTVMKRSDMSNFFIRLGERNKIMNLFIFYNGFNLLKMMPLLLVSIVFSNIYQPFKIHLRLSSYFWLLFHTPSIIKKRIMIQKQRKVSDREILHYLTYRIFDENEVGNKIGKMVIRFVNGISYGYCKIVGIRAGF